MYIYVIYRYIYVYALDSSAALCAASNLSKLHIVFTMSIHPSFPPSS